MLLTPGHSLLCSSPDPGWEGGISIIHLPCLFPCLAGTAQVRLGNESFREPSLGLVHRQTLIRGPDTWEAATGKNTADERAHLSGGQWSRLWDPMAPFSFPSPT